MAQVKKLQIGGSFRMNGREISGQEALDKLTPLLGGTTGGISTAIQQGKIVDYNPADNTIFITDDSGADLTLDYLPVLENMTPRDSTFKRRWRATFNTEKHHAALDLANLRSVDMIGAAAQDGPKDLTELRRGNNDWFEFTTNEDGSKNFLENHQGNADKFSIIDLIAAYHNSSDEDKKKYSTSKWTKDQLNEFSNFYKTIADKDAYWKGLKDRIKSNNLSKADIYTLKSFGFNPDGNNDESDVQNSGKRSIHADWKGDKGESEKLGIGWKKDKEGRWEIDAADDNIYKTSNWWTAGLDFLPEEFQRGFLLNGKLYKENEVKGNKAFVDLVGRWYGNTNKNWNDWYDAANNSGIRFVNDRIWDNKGTDYYGVFSQSFNPAEEYNEYLTPYFRSIGLNKTSNVADLTSRYENLPDGSRVFAYLNPISAFNTTGVPAITYIYYNPNNKENPYTENLTGLTENIYGGIGNFETYNYIPGNKGRKYALHRAIGVPGVENSILVDPEGNYYLGAWNKNANTIHGRDILNKELLNEILANPDDPRWNTAELEKLFNSNRIVSGPVTPIEVPGDTKLKTVLNTNIRLRKESGTIDKLQFGGPVKNSSTTKTQKDTTEAKTNISQAHKLDGSDGGLTQWEKLQIAAAIGDAAGVGASFAGPIGGVVGIGIGLGSTITRLVADVQQDGLDKGDLRRAGINTLFDLAALPASLLPAGDNFIRAKKLARTVKSIGQPVIKWLGTIGATTSTINIAQKWINGESPTSQDLAAFISGIGAGAVAGKQWSKQIGSSKLAANRSEAAVKISNANIPKEATASLGNNKELRYSTENLSNIIKEANGSQAKVTQRIIKDAKNQGVELTEESALPILEQLGIKVGQKGKVNFWIRKDGKWQWPGKRGEASVGYNPEQPKSAHGSAYYFLNPVARQRALGYMNASNSQPNLLENMTKREYKELTQGSLRDNTIGGALRRAALYNPKQFTNFTFQKYPSLIEIPGLFGRRGYYLRPGKTINSNKSNSGNNTRKIVSTQWTVNPELDEYSWGYFKKGGKIVKAQGGFNTQYISKGLYNKEYSMPQLGKPINDVDINEFIYNPSFTGITLGGIKPADMTSPYKPSADYTAIYGADFTPLNLSSRVNISVSDNTVNQTKVTQSGSTEAESQQNKNKRNPYSHDPDEPVEFNLPNIDDTLRAGVTTRSIAHDINLQRNALGELYKRQFQTPQYDLARYNYSDLQQGFNEASKPYLETRFVTSDPRDSIGFKLNKAQSLSALAGQYYAQLAQRKNQVDELNRQISGQNEAARIQTANEKSHYITGLRYQDKMLDSMKLNRIWSDVIAPYGHQMSQQSRDAWNQKADASYKEKVLKAKTDYNNKIASLPAVIGLKQQYVADEKSKTMSFEDWLELDAARLKTYNDAITSSIYGEEYQKDLKKAADERYKQLGAGWGIKSFWMKSGGTINVRTTNKNQRPAEEQIAINSAKSAKRSVDELSKALLKMLAQLTK